MTERLASPYRRLEESMRGPLTRTEKARAIFDGLLHLEPRLELCSRGLDKDLPQSERIKYAAGLASSTATGRIYHHLLEEKDPWVQEVLAYAFLEAYRRKMDQYGHALCNKYSALGAINTVGERDSFSNIARGQAAALLLTGRILSKAAISSLNTVAYGNEMD